MATITLVSRTSSGGAGNGSSSDAVFSPDGRTVAYKSAASNLVPGDTNVADDVFLQDLSTGAITLASVSSAGVQGNFPSYAPVFSPQGDKVAFSSVASNLVPGDTNGGVDIFVRDLRTGETTRVSTNAGGGQSSLGSISAAPVFSPDGQKIAFRSTAANLVPGDANDRDDAFIKDLQTGAVTRVSTSSAGVEGNDTSYQPVFSPDGNKVAFYSLARNLAPGDTNGTLDMFVKDLRTGAVTRASTNAAGGQANNSGGISGSVQDLEPAFSPDGALLAFASVSPDLVPGDTNGTSDIFIKNLATGAITRVSTDAGGGQTQGADADSNNPRFSPDGTKVVFESEAGTLVPGDTNGVGDIFVKDLATGEVTRISVDAAGVQANAYLVFGRPAFSPDGGRIVFSSRASNLAPGDTNDTVDVFVASFPAAPSASADAYRAGYDAPLVVQAAQGVLANDGDPNGDPLTAALATGPAQGTLVLNGDGSFIYTPNGRFVGVDQFTYRASDGAKSSTATVTLTVTGNIARVSTSAEGDEARNGADPERAVFSPDGRRVAFTSGTADLVADDLDGFTDVFIKDLATGAITLVSVDAGGLAGNTGNSGMSAFSPDGTKLAFTSDAFRLVAGSDVMVKDLLTGALTLVSADAAGVTGNSASTSAAFAPDGRQVAFTSFSSNLVPGDTNDQADILLKDLQTGAITRISTSAGGAQANGSSALPVFAPNGASVAFVSGASNLVPGDTNNGDDIFVKDLASGAVRRVSVGAGGAQGFGSSDMPAFSPDGTKVAFSSNAANLVAGDTNGIPDIFVHDLTSGTTTRVSTGAAGEQASAPGTMGSKFPVFSPDGTQVAFASPAALVLEDANGAEDVFVKNLATGAIRLVSTDAFEASGLNYSTRPSLSPDGKQISFFSVAGNLVPGDTNNRGDVFVKDLTRFPLGAIPPAPVPAAPTLALAPPQGGAPAQRAVINTARPVLGGNAPDATLVTFSASGAVVGTAGPDASGAFRAVVTPGVGFGASSITATAGNAAGTSAASAAVEVFRIPDPVAGVSTAGIASIDLGRLFDTGYQLQFIGGTEAAALVDGRLSLGVGTGEAFIQRLYGSLLGRSNDAGGMAFHRAALDRSMDKIAIADSFLNSAEFVSRNGAPGALTDAQLLGFVFNGLYGRLPTSAELQDGTAQVAQLGRAAVVAALADSTEAKSYLAASTAQVWARDEAGTLAHVLYKTGLGREVDLEAGLAFWKGVALSFGPAQVAAGISASAEFLVRHAGQDDAEYVRILYQDGLGRSPEDSGLQYYVSQLQSGAASRADVLLGIARSGEATAYLTRDL